MSFGVAAALEFSRMASEGMIAVLYSLRLSAWAIARPAIICALGATIAGYFCSSFLAPRYVGTMHDVLNVIRHRSITVCSSRRSSTRSKRQTGGRCISSAGTADIAANVFIRQYSEEKKSEETITASKAEFRRNDSNVVMILSRGQIQSRRTATSACAFPISTNTPSLYPCRAAGGCRRACWKGVFELPMREFPGLPALRRL